MGAAAEEPARCRSPASGGLRAVEWEPEATAEQDANGAYARALEALERLFLEQWARIRAEMEAARGGRGEQLHGPQEQFARSAGVVTDDQMAGLKQRLDELYQERVVRPVMEVRRLSAKIEERNRKRFRRRIGDIR